MVEKLLVFGKFGMLCFFFLHSEQILKFLYNFLFLISNFIVKGAVSFRASIFVYCDIIIKNK